MPNVGRQSRIRIGNIELSAMPTFQGTLQGKTQIFLCPTMPKLERGSPNNNGLSPFLKRSDREKMTKQSKVGLDSQEGLTKVDESSNMKD